MDKLKKKDRLVCVPCGREVMVDYCGASETMLWCCGKPMQNKGKKDKSKK